MPKYFISFFYLFCVTAFAYCEDNTMATILTEEKTVASCSLAIKVSTSPVSSEDAAAKASVEVLLISRDGTPVNGSEIQLTASAGTFLCAPKNDSVKADPDDRSCFLTGPDGKTKINLVNIPFNTQVKIKAKTNYESSILTASSVVSVTRKTVKKR